MDTKKGQERKESRREIRKRQDVTSVKIDVFHLDIYLLIHVMDINTMSLQQ